MEDPRPRFPSGGLFTFQSQLWVYILSQMFVYIFQNQIDEHLTEEERKAAWEEYENEKKGVINMTNSANFNMNNSLLMDRVNPDMIRVIIIQCSAVCLHFFEPSIFRF